MSTEEPSEILEPKSSLVPCKSCAENIPLSAIECPLCRSVQTATIQCPYCAESIRAEASICRFCHKKLNSGNDGRVKPLKIFICSSMLVICITAACSYGYVSPFLTMDRLKQALADRDMDAIDALVDFSTLRESVKAELLSISDARKELNHLGNSSFGVLGALIGANVANTVIDAFVSPAGLSALFSGSDPAGILQNAQPNNQFHEETSIAPALVEHHVKNIDRYPIQTVSRCYYGSINRFVVEQKCGSSTVLLILGRTGLFSWKLKQLRLSRPEIDAKTLDTRTVVVNELTAADSNKLPINTRLLSINGYRISSIEDAAAVVRAHADAPRWMKPFLGPLKFSVQQGTDLSKEFTLIPRGQGVALSQVCHGRLQSKSCTPPMSAGKEWYRQSDNIYGFPTFDWPYDRFQDQSLTNPDSASTLKRWSKIWKSGKAVILKPDADFFTDGSSLFGCTQVEILKGTYLSGTPEPAAEKFWIDTCNVRLMDGCTKISDKRISLGSISDLHLGMRESAVETILGKDLARESTTNIFALPISILRWSNSDGSYIACIFENGTLTDVVPFFPRPSDSKVILVTRKQTKIPLVESNGDLTIDNGVIAVDSHPVSDIAELLQQVDLRNGKFLRLDICSILPRYIFRLAPDQWLQFAAKEPVRVRPGKTLAIFDSKDTFDQCRSHEISNSKDTKFIDKQIEDGHVGAVESGATGFWLLDESAIKPNVPKKSPLMAVYQVGFDRIVSARDDRLHQAWTSQSNDLCPVVIPGSQQKTDPHQVSRSDVDKLTARLSYDQVCDILHSRGVLQSRDAFRGHGGMIRKWFNSDGSYLSCVFIDEKLDRWYDFLIR